MMNSKWIEHENAIAGPAITLSAEFSPSALDALQFFRVCVAQAISGGKFK